MKDRQTLELPVNETRGIRVSLAIASPISAPPQNEVKIEPGKLFFSRILATNFVIAMVINGVVGAPFQTTELPQTRAKQAFHPRTAHGKLKAVITPTTPRGFHISSII